MPAIRISCFGPLQVVVDGQPIHHFDTDKARALLVYLAVENRSPHPRARLAGLLWSDQPEEQALHSLRQTLSSLRRTVGDPGAQSPFLLAERETVGLNPENLVWVDVHAFISRLTAAYRHYQRRDQGGWVNLRRLSAALALRQGPFLTHLRLRGAPLFDEWQAITREDLDRRALQGLALLAEVYERRGEYALSRQTAQRILDIAPWDEQAHQQLIRLFALDGQRSAAQNQYRALRRMLREQLDMEPSAETAALLEQIRAAGPGPSPALLRFPAAPAGLPAFPTPFIGREQELDEIADLLADPACRLLTLHGPGGIGKTRLALEAARQQVGLLTDGIFFVPLAGASTAAQITSAVADALGLPLTGQDDLHARLLDYLRAKRVLLVVDNCEQFLGDGQNIAPLVDILACSPGSKLLATSRERLMLEEEWVYPLGGLHYPLSHPPAESHAAPEWIEQYDALRLFYQRARQARIGFSPDTASLPYAIQVCQMLEGLPLGVELAAAALWNRPCREIAEEIARGMSTLNATAHNATPRHRSLWAAFEVSWHLLSPEEQALFCRLGVFQGGFSLDAAQKVAGAAPEDLARLAGRSLIRLEPGDHHSRGDRHSRGARYSLHEAVRQFAAEKLSGSGCAGETRPAHARYYSTFLAARQPELLDHHQKEALDAIHTEIGNATAAWDWLLESRGFAALAACVDPLYQYFNTRSRFADGIALFEKVVSVLESAAEAVDAEAVEAEALLGTLLARIGSLAHYARQNELAFSALLRAEQIFTHLDLPAELAFCRAALGGAYLRAKDFQRALECGQQNLAYSRLAGDGQGENRALYLLGLVLNRLGRFQESKDYFLGAVEAGRQGGDRRRLIAPLNMLGDIACSEGDYAKAEALFTQSLEIARDLHDVYYQAILLNNLAGVFHYDRRFAEARQAYAASLAICREIGDRDGEAMALNNLGELAVAEGDYAQALALSTQALEIARQVGEEWTLIACLNNLGEASNGLGQPAQALRPLKEALRTALEIEALDSAARFAVNAGRSFHLLGRRAEAAALYRATLAHPAAEHDARARAAAGLAELGLDAQINPDETLLVETVACLVLGGE